LNTTPNAQQDVRFAGSSSRQQRPQTNSHDINSLNINEGMDLMLLLKIYGIAQQKLVQFNCQDAIKILEKLGRKQAKTGWVMQTIGRCYFEMN